METFSAEETERLNKILAVEVNPFLSNGNGKFELPLGDTTRNWLFTTHMNLPDEAQEDLQHILSEEIASSVRVHELNDYLSERQVGSAPKWWELGFFDFDRKELWAFLVEQCRRYYDDAETLEVFDFYIRCASGLDYARWVLKVHKLNPDRFTDEEVEAALGVFDRFYPLDFSDYDEPASEARDPYTALRNFIGSELSDLSSVFSKRWFEFKLLDELASFEHYIQDGQRDSELSKQMYTQMRGYMFGQALAFGRMVEHYRWKFSYEPAALQGLRAAEAEKARGKKGGEASGKARRENLEHFLTEIERLGDLFPRMTEEAICQQAYVNASYSRRMPKSKKTIESYGTALRSEQPYKDRYDAVFRRNA